MNIQPLVRVAGDVSMMGSLQFCGIDVRIWDYGLICSFDNHFIFPLSVFSSMRL